MSIMMHKEGLWKCTEVLEEGEDRCSVQTIELLGVYAKAHCGELLAMSCLASEFETKQWAEHPDTLRRIGNLAVF
jgi:hypothetical protein